MSREQRYLKDPDPFDWYQRYSNNPQLRSLIDKAVPRSAAILVPGSGSSRLSEDMLADGYTGGISNIDISRTAIDLMADRCKDRAGLTCACRLGALQFGAPTPALMRTLPLPLLSYTHTHTHTFRYVQGK